MEIRKYTERETGRQAALTRELAAASDAYYNGGHAVMSDIEFDKKLEELKALEDASGFCYDISPSVKVGADVVDALEKSVHEQPALSLDKIKYKNREDLKKWAGDREVVLSWKMDGLTVVLTYDNGKLTKAVTRGNGTEGSDITHNARFFEGIPLRIPYEDHLVVRGEAVMSFEEFERVNAENDGVYENPRNLASATIQMLDSNESRKRQIRFYAFKLVMPEPEEGLRLSCPETDGSKLSFDGWSEHMRLSWLQTMGFQIVGMNSTHNGARITGKNILEAVEWFRERVNTLEYPTDGIVIGFDDAAYAAELGSTGHHERGSIALKWTDETVGTTIRSIEWSVGKTGAITPVAIFDTVRLGLGSNVTKASLHNLSIMERLPVTGHIGETQPLMIGSTAQVYLANMIIPQIESIHNDDSATPVSIPGTCPVCGGETVIRNENGVKTLICVNPNCSAKQVKRIATFASRDGMDIGGLSEKTIEFLTGNGYIHTAADFYSLKDDPEKIGRLRQEMGWGDKSVNNLLAAIDASRDTDLKRFMYSLSIPLLGHDLSKKLNVYFRGDIDEFLAFVQKPDEAALSAEEGIGPVKAGNLVTWCRDITSSSEKWEDFMRLVGYLRFKRPEETTGSDQSLAGLTFVITGAVHNYKNRDEFKASVEARGGKVSGSVSKSTSFLVNNEPESRSAKNVKAKSLGVPIISEDEFIEKFGK